MTEPESPRVASPSLGAGQDQPGAEESAGERAALVPDEAVNVALTAVARYWKGSRSVLQAYPSRPLTRVMLEAAAPHIAGEAAARADRAEARLDEIRRTMATFLAVRADCGKDTRDLAEGIRQVLDREPAP